MDAIAVNPLDRWRYRLGHWLREKLYERPVGFDLEDGAMPASIQAINALFAGRPLSVFLPYEVFTGEGLYKFVPSGTAQRKRERFAFALNLTTGRRLTAAEGQAVQYGLLCALPEGWMIQSMAMHLGDDNGGYSAILSIAAPDSASRNDVVEMRARIIAELDAQFIDCDILNPRGLLRVVSRVFDRDPINEYDDGDLLKNQMGHSTLSANVHQITLSDAQGAFRELRIYAARRFGWTSPATVAQLYPGLISQHEFIAVASGCRQGKGYVGGFAIAEVIQPGSPTSLSSMFTQAGWVIEQQPYQVHLPLLTMMPMTLDEPMSKLLRRCRRWQPLDLDTMGAMLLLPYQATSNTAAADTAGAVLPFNGAQSYA